MKLYYTGMISLLFAGIFSYRYLWVIDRPETSSFEETYLLFFVFFFFIVAGLGLYFGWNKEEKRVKKEKMIARLQEASLDVEKNWQPNRNVQWYR